jgi:cytochrome c oxidase cbb3-type subunit 4
MDSGTLSGVVTALMMLAFIAVTLWAYSGRRRDTFDAAARLPLEEDESKRDDARGRGR